MLSHVVVGVVLCSLALAQEPAVPDAASSAQSQPAVRAGFWWEDYDGDGLPDAFTITATGNARLLRNQGDGSFADVTLISGLDALSETGFASWFDFDRDGAPDLFLGSASQPGRLLRNAHDGTFQDVTEFVGLQQAGHALEVQWLDYDLDGSTDLALRTVNSEELYHALPNGRFESVDLGLATQLAQFAVGASNIDEGAAMSSDPADSDATDPRKHGAQRRRKAAGTLPPVAGSGITPVPPSWTSAGGPVLNISTCTDVIKNQATAACISASSTPTMGWLYPLSINLNVSGAGDVGIGTITPTAKLDVVGTTRMSDTLTLTPSTDQALDVSTGSIYKGGIQFIHTKGVAGNTGLGLNALRSVTTGVNNTASGDRALRTNSTGGSNTASGYEALFSNTTGSSNTASGVKALRSNTTGNKNTADGLQALYSNTTGSFNTASGYQALKANTSGVANTANGYKSLASNTTGGGNTASGMRALAVSTTGNYNTANGNGALRNNTSGGYNTASGNQALTFNTTGAGNTASGDKALLSNTTGISNTADGKQALSSNTTGGGNTASGYRALYSSTTGFLNTACGGQALLRNTIGSFNTASGFNALYSNTTGTSNTASGYQALRSNTTGYRNTAAGDQALSSNTSASYNTAGGAQALKSNTTGDANTAFGKGAMLHNTTGRSDAASGFEALRANTTGGANTASGYRALLYNTTGGYNTANGFRALYANTTGRGNIAVGTRSGYRLTTGDYNIAIGNYANAGEGATIRLGSSNHQTRAFIAGIRGVTTGAANAIPVLVDSNGQLGTVSSSRRFKKDIVDMGDATENLLKLRPVRFRYKQEQTMPDGSEVPMEYGLIAEEVAEVFPDLVIYGDDGKPFTVKYHILSSMLLNEMKKEKEEHACELGELRRELSDQRNEFETRLAAVEARASVARTPAVASGGSR